MILHTTKFNLIWLVIKNIIAIFLIIILFQVTSTSFEKIVLSGLVLIYYSVAGLFSTFGIAILKTWELLEDQLCELKKQIRNINIDSTNEIEAEINHKEKKQAEDKYLNEYFIKMIFRSIIYLITFAYLILAILNKV